MTRAPEQRDTADPRPTESAGHAETDEEHDRITGTPRNDVDVDHREARSGNSAGTRVFRARATISAPIRMKRGREQQDLYVEPERLEQTGEGVDEGLTIEEGLADTFPARGERNQDDECSNDGERARPWR